MPLVEQELVSKKCVHTDLKTILVHKYLDTKQDTAVVSDK
jgi:hypothetical protein